MSDEIKVKIVEAGVLPLYVKLLSPDREESEQKEATKGLWSLAFKCKERVASEPGCTNGNIVFIVLFINVVIVVYRHRITKNCLSVCDISYGPNFHPMLTKINVKS